MAHLCLAPSVVLIFMQCCVMPQHRWNVVVFKFFGIQQTLQLAKQKKLEEKNWEKINCTLLPTLFVEKHITTQSLLCTYLTGEIRSKCSQTEELLLFLTRSVTKERNYTQQTVAINIYRNHKVWETSIAFCCPMNFDSRLNCEPLPKSVMYCDQLARLWTSSLTSSIQALIHASHNTSWFTRHTL